MPHKAPTLRKADFALFACSWWPNADLPRLRIMAYLAIWLFLWDDEIDQTSGTLAGDFDAAQAWRSDTLNAVTYYLGLCEGPLKPSSRSRLIHSFKEIGEALSVYYSVGECGCSSIMGSCLCGSLQKTLGLTTSRIRTAPTVREGDEFLPSRVPSRARSRIERPASNS